MIPVNMKLVVFEILHSILRICSVATVTGSSGDSSHFNLIKGQMISLRFRVQDQKRQVRKNWEPENHKVQPSKKKKFSLSSHLTHQKLVHEFLVAYMSFRSCGCTGSRSVQTWDVPEGVDDACITLFCIYAKGRLNRRIFRGGNGKLPCCAYPPPLNMLIGLIERSVSPNCGLTFVKYHIIRSRS